MSKRSNRGAAYFYAKGQRDKLNGVALTGRKLREMRVKLKPWALCAWRDGYQGY